MFKKTFEKRTLGEERRGMRPWRMLKIRLKVGYRLQKHQTVAEHVLIGFIKLAT